MPSRCRVHGSTSECISSQLTKLKIALALVVLRDKPSDRSPKEFVNSLLVFHHDKEQRWKAEYYRLKREVLQLRQQQLLLGINNTILIQPSPSSGSDADVTRQETNHLRHSSLALLTPPDSQSFSQSQNILPIISSTSSRLDDGVSNIDRMEFLRAYFYLEHQLRLSRSPSNNMRCTNILENDVVRQSVLSVLQHIEREASKDKSDFPKCLDSLHVCVQLLDRHDKWSPAIREKFSELSSCWLERVAQGDSVLKHYSLLQTLVDSNGMAVQLAAILVKSIAESQQRIKEWEWDGTELIPLPVLAHFSNASYYILLLEKTFSRLAPSDKTRFVTVLSHVEQRVHLNFPLFAASLMRLAQQLAN